MDSKYRKSSFSPIAGGVWCVEVAKDGDNIKVRDSKDQNGHVLTFNADEWRAFIRGVKNNEFNV